MKSYGLCIILFCLINALILLIPYSELSEKGIELTLVPLLLLVVFIRFFFKERSNFKPKKVDVFSLIVMSIIAAATFYHPDPNSIWIMIFFILVLYLPAYLSLLTRGVVFVWKAAASNGGGSDRRHGKRLDRHG